MITITNNRRRMLHLSLGNMQRRTSIVHVTTPAKSGANQRAGGVGRKRLSVDQHLRIPARTTIDRMPDGNEIPESIRVVPSIAAALERGDITIKD